MLIVQVKFKYSILQAVTSNNTFKTLHMQEDGCCSQQNSFNFINTFLNEMINKRRTDVKMYIQM